MGMRTADMFGTRLANDLRRRLMNLIEKFIAAAQGTGQRVALPEGNDPRVLHAARRLHDEAIAARVGLNGQVIEDMYKIMALADYDLDDAGWAMVREKVVGQLQRRIVMRNGQFSFPLSQDRIEAIYAGDIDPIDFDYSIMEQAA